MVGCAGALLAAEDGAGGAPRSAVAVCATALRSVAAPPAPAPLALAARAPFSLPACLPASLPQHGTQPAAWRHATGCVGKGLRGWRDDRMRAGCRGSSSCMALPWMACLPPPPSPMPLCRHRPRRRRKRRRRCVGDNGRMSVDVDVGVGASKGAAKRRRCSSGGAAAACACNRRCWCQGKRGKLPAADLARLHQMVSLPALPPASRPRAHPPASCPPCPPARLPPSCPPARLQRAVTVRRGCYRRGCKTSPGCRRST